MKSVKDVAPKVQLQSPGHPSQNPPAIHSVTPQMGGFVTSITPALSSVPASTFGYYAQSRKLAKFTDPNGNSQYFHFVDPLDRPSATALLDTSSATRGWTLTQYNSADTQVDSYLGIAGTSGSGCSNCRHNQAALDALGRVTSNRLVNDPDGETYADATYDSSGRVTTVSNPYRSTSDPTYGLETPSYDGQGRTTQVKHADNNIAHTYYGASVGTGGGATSQLCPPSTYGLGYPVLIVDEAGNKRQTWTDGFGRVIETDEPGSNGSLTVGTCYSYDMNGNLTQVTSLGLTQTQKPTYTYDMLSRITSKNLPETGKTCFYYTTSGGTCGAASSGTLCSGDPTAVCRRTDARNITTTYAYDALNRLTQKSYNDSNPTTPTVTYYYDQTTYNGLTITNGKGRGTGMSDGSGQTAWSYDPAGNILSEEPTINGQTKTINYTYNLDGSIHTIQYPGNRTVTYVEGNAQRMTAAQDTTNTINYATSATYAPQGALATMQNGSSVVSTMFYNTRLELCRISVKNTGTAPANCASATMGNVLDLTYGYASGNNGNIATLTNNVTSGRTQTYTYDTLNRLLTAQAQASSGGDCWGQSFGNNGPPPTLAGDALANLFWASSIKCTSPSPQYTMNTSNNNQFTGTGIGYDSDGDMTADTAYSYTYDAENRIITVSGMTGGPYCYTYDGNGLRVMKANANGGSCTSAVTVDMLYWRNIAGNTIAETDGTGSTTNSNYNEYIFFAGRRTAQSNPSSGSVYYYFEDHLGSTRVITTATGTACYEVDYLPYGTENTPAGFSNTCTTRYRFTGYERDAESAQGTSAGNDYAFARYYNSRLGRFMSGDPLDGSIADPQTWNGYTYVRDNPLSLIDPSGMDGCPPDTSTSVCVSADPPDPFGTDPTSGGWPVGQGSYPPSCFGGACGATPRDAPGTRSYCLAQNRAAGLRGKELVAACPFPGAKAKPKTGFTFGVRQPGQTFSACMAANSGNYSIAGVFNIQNSGGQFVLGNDVANLLFGNASEGAGGLLFWEGGKEAFSGGVGTAMTYGRRTSSIMDMNIAGARGGTKGGIRILGKTGAEEIAGWLSGVAELKLAGDVGLTGAEVIGCLINQ